MDAEKFVSDCEELGRQVDRGLSRAAGMLDLIDRRVSYGDWLADDQSRSGWLIGDEVIPVVADDRLPRGVVLALTPAQWTLWRRGRITTGKRAKSGVSDRGSTKKTR